LAPITAQELQHLHQFCCEYREDVRLGFTPGTDVDDRFMRSQAITYPYLRSLGSIPPTRCGDDEDIAALKDRGLREQKERHLYLAPRPRPRPAGPPESNPELDTIWNNALAAPDDHPYLITKKIGPEGFKLRGDTLLVDVRTSTGLLVGIQTIGPDGRKLYIKGSRPSQGFYRLGDLDKARTIYITEGVATAHTIKDLTPFCAVISAMSARTLHVPVDQLSRYLGKMVVAADHDKPGLKSARDVFRKYGIPYTAPSDTGDWNDLHCKDMDQIGFLGDIKRIATPPAKVQKMAEWCDLFRSRHPDTLSATPANQATFRRYSEIVHRGF